MLAGTTNAHAPAGRTVVAYAKLMKGTPDNVLLLMLVLLKLMLILMLVMKSDNVTKTNATYLHKFTQKRKTFQNNS